MLLRRGLVLLILSLLFIVLSGCGLFGDEDVESEIDSIEIDLTHLEDAYDVDGFDIGKIRLKVNFADGSHVFMDLTEAMIDASSLELLASPGTHMITVRYEGFTTTFQLVLTENVFVNTLMMIYEMGVAEGLISDSYEDWLDSIRGQDGADGRDGQDGSDGIDGLTPHIGTNGHWWIGNSDTGVRVQGLSAYEIYLLHYPDYKGNEAQWIDDLIHGRLVFDDEPSNGDEQDPIVGVVFNEATGRFEWEEGAEIEIGVDSVSMGQALVAQWDADFPELAGKLTFREYWSGNSDSSGMQGIEVGQGSAPDVALVITPQHDYLYELHEYLVDIGRNHTLNTAFEIFSERGYVYMPAFYDGMAFSWNQTMLEEWGIDITDTTGNGLPDVFNTWEQIFAWSDDYATERPTFNGDTIYEFFPISLQEIWSGYASLTAGGWQLFPDGDYNDPGFDTSEFKAGLEFIQAFSETHMNKDETGATRAGNAMGWRWDAYLEGAYPFALVGTWMDIEGQATWNDLTFRFGQMPTWQGNDLTPLVKTKGFVINAYSDYPSAAHEVMRWLFTQDTMTTMIDNSAYLPALELDSDIMPDLSDDPMKQEFSFALSYNYFEPLIGLPNDPTLDAMRVYYELNLGDFLVEVWDGTMTPEEAQTAIHAAATAWMEFHNPED